VPPVGIAVIGYGGMGRAHAYGYTVAPRIRELDCVPHLRVLSGRTGDAVERAAAAYGFDDWTTDWRAAIERDDVDLVDICTPPGTHAEIAEAAAAAGKAVLCEKPLAVDYADGRRALDAVRGADVQHAVGFNYRRLPAVSLLKRLVDEGAVGTVRLWRAIWLSDEFCDPAIPFDWRFDAALGGTTIADLGSHLVDLARWIVGEIEEVSAQSETFVRSRTDPDTGRARDVEIDDASSALVRFAGGATGIFEMARSCVRRPCDWTIEVNGSDGTLVFDYPRLNELRYASAGDDPSLYGMRRIRAEHPTHPYADAWWPIGQGVGYGETFGNQAADLLEHWSDGAWTPSFDDGLAAVAVCAAMERAAAERRWVRVEEIERD
jgi:predicted dehydrogenase